ncbi:MAG: hypothetical protein ACO3EZ_06865 [Prochlorotrichaceae cyanobacterium]
MLFPSLQPRFWKSLGLSILFSFSIPIVILSSLWGCLLTLAQFPWTHQFGGLCLSAFVAFLSTFGTGSPWLGIVVMSGVAAIAGAMFDAYAFSLSRSWD